MPTVHYYGKKTDFIGKTLFEILGNLRHFGVNRMLIKQRELARNPGAKCYYIVKKVEPVMDEKLEQGAIYAERIFDGARVPRSALSKWIGAPSPMDIYFRRHYEPGVHPTTARADIILGKIHQPYKVHRVVKDSEVVDSIVLNPLLMSQFKMPGKDMIPSSQQYRSSSSSPSPSTPDKKPENQVTEKRSLTKKIVDEIKHYYHGFRLLFIDLRVSSRYVKKLLNGEQLSRREHQQLVRSTSDLFRLLPFSVFIIVPFMEFLLPVFLKFFPSMLPSTFQTTKDKDAKIKSQLKVKIDMAKFLQQTLDEMAFQAKGESHSDEAKKFAKFFEEVRASGAGASNADILKYSKLFEDEITLDSMTRQQLVACCKLLELQPIGTNVFLRYQLRARLKALKADDEMIQNEGIQSLTVSELQAACRARGMRALGVPIERLQAQLSQWLELSLDAKIPPSLLLLSRALYVPENIPTVEQLKATIQSLPEIAGTEVRYNIGENEGKVDNRTKADFLRQEEEEIRREELQESVESFKSNYDENLIDKAEEIIERAAKMHQTTILKVVRQKSEKNDLTIEFLESIERDLDKLLSDKDEILSGVEHPEEEYDLRELKEEMEEYREEIGEKELQRIKESKAARRLSKRVDKMIVNLDMVLDKIEEREKELKELKKRKEMIAQKYGAKLETKRPEEKQSN